MAALQGYITNSRGREQSAVAHDQMTAMIRTWEGGIKIVADKDNSVRIFAGPHGDPGQYLLATVYLGDIPTLVVEK